MGLVNRVYPADELVPRRPGLRTRPRRQLLAPRDAGGQGPGRRRLDPRASTSRRTEAFRLVKEPARRPDFREGVAAFTEKRAAGLPAAAVPRRADQLTTADRGRRDAAGSVTGLLEGVTVVETGVLMTVDHLGRLLGDEGADVVKVETPGLRRLPPQHHDPVRPRLVHVPPRAEPQQAQPHLRRPHPGRPRGAGPPARTRRHLHHRQRRRHQPQARTRLRVGARDPARHRVLPGHRLRRVRSVRRGADARADDGRARRWRAADGARRRRASSSPTGDAVGAAAAS